MIRDIGQRGHEKKRKSGIVRGRGKAGGVGVGVDFFCPPPTPGPSRPFKGPPYSSESL